MKLLFVNACGTREGDINHALLTLQNLPPSVEVVVATIPRGAVTDALRALPGAQTVEAIEMGGSELPSPRRSPGSIGEAREFAAALRRVVRLARREQVDMICAIDRTVATYLAASAARLTRRPFVMIAAYPFYGRQRPLNRLALRYATCVVSHSAYLTRHLRRYVADPDRIVTIPDPLDTERYVPDQPESNALRASWSLPADSQVVLLAGRVNQYKGHDDLVQAAAIVVRQLPNTRFLMVGRADPEVLGVDGVAGTFKEHIQRSIEKHNLGSHVLFLGYVPDLTAAIGASDIVVMPSKEEPYGLVALEGMAMAKPVVATRAGGVPEFMLDGETGLLVPPGDAQALATALLTLLQHPERARVMGIAGREHVLQHYSVVGYIARLLPILEKVAGGGKNPPTTSPSAQANRTAA